VEAIGSNVRTGQTLAVVMGAGGMAMAVARRLGDTHRVMIVDRDAGHLERQVASLRGEGHDASGVVCDVTDADDVQRVADAAQSAGPVRALAHVVGVSPSLGDAATILRVNLRGPALVAEAFLPILGPGCAAVFISSLAAHLGSFSDDILGVVDEPLAPDLVDRMERVVHGFTPIDAYQFSKIGLMRMVARGAAFWGSRGARIVSLSPGLIATPQGAVEFQNPQKLALYQLTPLQREGTMIEIADAVEFLLSDRASFITGTDLLVDGGVAAAARNASVVTS
jgi:NAD(P)-dependent dehydrogenase (short-subunit alcohol dehydrogenase family)